MMMTTVPGTLLAAAIDNSDAIQSEHIKLIGNYFCQLLKINTSLFARPQIHNLDINFDVFRYREKKYH